MNGSALNKHLKKYNQENNVIIVSSYPQVKDGKFTNVSGVSTYTYHMVPEFGNRLGIDDRKIIILAEIINGKEEIFEDNGVLVYRCWKRKGKMVFHQICKASRKFNKVKKMLIHFEFNMYAEMVTTGTLPIFLLRLRLMGKQTNLLLHQVAEKLSGLSGHIGVRSKSLKMRFYNFALKIFYKLVMNTAHKIIVHDDILKTRLKNICNRTIFVIPHGLGEYKNMCVLMESRNYLNVPKDSFVVLCFGFITWYKGSDWIVNQFAKYYEEFKDVSVELIMAGGKSATLSGKNHYEEFFQGVKEKADDYPNIKVTGFVPDEDVKHYFCSADVVVLPYRTQMSASGPFAVGLSFDRPFLLSKQLEGVLETYDVKENMQRLGLSKNDITFEMDKEEFFKKIMKLINDKETKEKLSFLSTRLKKERQWKNTSEKFLYVIDA